MKKTSEKIMLVAAQGFGIGRIPAAPGTFGSVLGLVLCGLLLSTGSPFFFLAGTILTIGASIWLCGVAERLLGSKDPGSVVLDEICAMPVCFFSWIGISLIRNGRFPQVTEVFSRDHWGIVLGLFAAFRFFDILKPWPVRQSQALPRGWGITVDDLLAAVYVNLVYIAVDFFKGLV